MTDKNQVEVGDIILVAGTGFLPKGIQFFMNIYRKRKGLPKRKLYNHAAAVVDLWGTQWIAEASAKGVRVFQYPNDYVRRQDCKVLGWVEPLDDSEKEALSKTAIAYALHPTRYDVMNFWYQARYILTGKWKGPIGEKAKKRVYCSEFIAILIDELSDIYEGKTWDKNPLDIELLEGELLYTKYIDKKRPKEVS